MIADFVNCNSCGEEMKVLCGTEVCPLCKKRGALTWAGDVPEIEASEFEIKNIDDYDNVVNGTEKSID